MRFSKDSPYEYTFGEVIFELAKWTMIAFISIPSIMFVIVMSPVFAGFWLIDQLPHHIKTYRAKGNE